jgi:hypothetical protein
MTASTASPGASCPTGESSSRPRATARAGAGSPGSMLYALDLIWLDKRGAVVRVDRNVGPWRMRTCLKARSVIETVAGQADGFLAELQ